MNNISFKGLPKNTRYVSKKLIVGSRQGLLGLRKLQKEEGVNLVLDLRDKSDILRVLFEKFLCKVLRLKHKFIPINFKDSKAPIKEIYKKALTIIETNSNGQIFVHCRSGRHRSLLLCAASEINENRIKTEEHFEQFLKKYKFYEIRKIRNLSPSKKKELLAARFRKLNFQRQKFIEIFIKKDGQNVRWN